MVLPTPTVLGIWDPPQQVLARENLLLGVQKRPAGGQKVWQRGWGEAHARAHTRTHTCTICTHSGVCTHTQTHTHTHTHTRTHTHTHTHARTHTHTHARTHTHTHTHTHCPATRQSKASDGAAGVGKGKVGNSATLPVEETTPAGEKKEEEKGEKEEEKEEEEEEEEEWKPRLRRHDGGWGFGDAGMVTNGEDLQEKAKNHLLGLLPDLSQWNTPPGDEHPNPFEVKMFSDRMCSPL